MQLQRLKLKCNWCKSDELVERCGNYAVYINNISLQMLSKSARIAYSVKQLGYRVDNWDLIVLFWQKQEIFLFIKVSRLVLRATQPTVQ